MVNLLTAIKRQTTGFLLGALLVALFYGVPVGASFAPSIVKSVQYGDVAVNNGNSTGTSTITAVNTAKSLVVYLGQKGTASGTDLPQMCNLTLTNSTTVTATRTGTSSDQTVGYVVIEFY